MKKSNILLLSMAFLTSYSLHAAKIQMKPGLWENTINIKSQSGKIESSLNDLKSKMASMPAEQRKMMEEVMAKQGLSVNQEASKIKVCISKEQAENLEIPQGENSDCRHEILKRTASSIKMRFNCTGETKASGEGEYTLLSPIAYKGKSIVNAVVNGKQDKMEMSQMGKWLSSDCGNIKSNQSKN